MTDADPSGDFVTTAQAPGAKAGRLVDRADFYAGRVHCLPIEGLAKPTSRSNKQR